MGLLIKDHYFVKTPWWIKKIYPECVWDITPKEKILYLSFDDGPHPTITPFVLDLLKQYKAKATFFCIGENVQKHQATYEQIIDEGHAIGNHTQHHLNGWKTNDQEYIRNISEAAAQIRSNLFRPPYGRIKRSQIRLLKEVHPDMKIIMWNILAGDWVEELSPEKCYKRFQQKISDGDVIVLHDMDKAFPRLQYILPQLLKFFSEKGYQFRKIR